MCLHEYGWRRDEQYPAEKVLTSLMLALEFKILFSSATVLYVKMEYLLSKVDSKINKVFQEAKAFIKNFTK